jgi:hypothetical protein
MQRGDTGFAATFEERSVAPHGVVIVAVLQDLGKLQ